MFTRAIVQQPCENFAGGITTSSLGAPNYKLALKQHEAYCRALIQCGLSLIRLAPSPQYPDATFVEDTAVVTNRSAVIMRPGVKKRRGEIAAIVKTIPDCFQKIDFIQPPGRIDGGDVCQIGNHFLIGISKRTNKDGAWQLALHLEAAGHTASTIDITKIGGLLHLKSGLACLGNDCVLVTKALKGNNEFDRIEVVVVPEDEEYAANCIRVNDYVLIAAGFPKVKKIIEDLGYRTIELDVSEFQKMDGGLSCLSLRF